MDRQTRKKRKREKQERSDKWLCRQRSRPCNADDASSPTAETLGEAEHKTAGATSSARPQQAHAHEWVVFSTAITEGWLMLQCVRCGLHGTVEDPTGEEWSEAFHAPSKPYRWRDKSRVTVKGFRTGDRRYVVRATAGPRCECYEKRRIIEPRDYERLPLEIMRPVLSLTAQDRAELEMMAGVATKGKLCSFLLPYYLQCFQQDTGDVPGDALQEAARRIELIDRKGLHCSPGVVAHVLGQMAGPGDAPGTDSVPRVEPDAGNETAS